MNEEVIEIRASDLLALGKSIISEPNFTAGSKLLTGAISLTELCYGTNSTQCSGLTAYREKLVAAAGPREQQSTIVSAVGNDRVKVTHCDHGIMTRPLTSLFSFKCLSPR